MNIFQYLDSRIKLFYFYSFSFDEEIKKCGKFSFLRICAKFGFFDLKLRKCFLINWFNKLGGKLSAQSFGDPINQFDQCASIKLVSQIHQMDRIEIRRVFYFSVIEILHFFNWKNVEFSIEI